MDDRIDARHDREIESTVDLLGSQMDADDDASDASDDSFEHSYSLFSNREIEPEPGDADESPIETLMKSGQPRLSLVRGDEEQDDEGGLIELAPVDPEPEVAEVVADTWPWLADVTATDSDDPDTTPTNASSLDGQFVSDLMSSPTACGARPTSMDVSPRRPMPALPRPGEIAAVAQKIGAQFAGDARINRTPEVPSLATTLPKPFTPAAPVKTSGDRVTSSSVMTQAAASATIAPTMSIPNIMASMTAPSVPFAPSTPRKTTDTPKRIGGGKLIQSRLTWKPGDPFAQANRADGAPGRFRWELMLSTACGTAVFGMAFFWIMRMVF